MNKDLYVRNISFDATEEDLKKLFAVAGKVKSVHLVTDPKTGQLRGSGFVKMATEQDAKEALEILDGALLINRVIEVSEALPQKPKEHNPRRGRR